VVLGFVAGHALVSLLHSRASSMPVFLQPQRLS
jgi:hypothetical protein